MESVRGTDLITLFVPVGGIDWARDTLRKQLDAAGTSDAARGVLQDVLYALPETVPLNGMLIHAGLDDAGRHHFLMTETVDDDLEGGSFALMDTRFHMTHMIRPPPTATTGV
jgi:hypothetical protein